MSTLWTPSGEHPVPPTTQTGPAGHTAREAGPTSSPPAPGAPRPGPSGLSGRTPEELREAQAEMEAVRDELLRAPVEVVIANHAMGLWELAALHLSRRPAGLPEAKLAIDALGSLLDCLQGRLGEPEKTLVDGLAELRMAFVQIANAERSRQPGSAEAAPGGSGR